VNAGCGDFTALLQQRRLQDRAAFLVSFFQMGWHSQCHWLARVFILAAQLWLNVPWKAACAALATLYDKL